MAILNNSNAISTAGGYDINNSLRFRASASAYLNRTPATAGNRKTWTWSSWIKRGELLTTEDYDFFAAGASDGATFRFSGGASNAIRLVDYNGSSFFMNLITTQSFRDPSAWYHIVVAVDSTQATTANRVKLYVNGTQVTAFSTAVYPSLNQDCAHFNNNGIHNIGRNPFNASQYYDGYLAEINFIDGQALTPSSFGETDTTTGSWKPKAYTGTYGTNGFELNFSDIATTSGSNAGLGKDFSGNANYFNTNNISVTAGTTYDAMIDSPTLTSATVANYATLNPLLRQIGTGQAPTNGNLKLTSNSTGFEQICCATMASTSGKWYWETTVSAAFGSFGIADSNNASFTSVICTTSTTTNSPASFSWGWELLLSTGNKRNNATSSSYGSAASSGDVYMCAVDIDNGRIWWGKNGTWFASGNPSAGTNAAFTNVSGNIIPWFNSSDSGSNTQNINFGQRPFAYTPPTGFVRLNTFNLPDSTIVKGNTVMDATTYTGDGATTKSITNTSEFRPDLIWIKGRSNTGSHLLQDSNRGFGTATKLSTNSTNAENNASADATDPMYGYITAANSNGFTVNVGTTPAQTNNNGVTFVGWQWQAGQGTNTSNTSGSTTSTVSVNTTAGFSIVKYTGTGSAATIGHGLGVAPKWIVVKGRNTAIEWLVYHTSLGATQYITLNTTGAAASAASAWNNTAPTSSVFSVLSAGSTNFSGTNYVAYCWAEIAGFSKFGSYTGNGSADGPFVYTGFRPKFIMRKQTSNNGDVGGWIMFDASRDDYNVATKRLLANSSNAEATPGNNIDILSNGWKERNSDGYSNASGQTYIYMAFAENPFKNANAR